MTALSEVRFCFRENRRSHDTLHKLQQRHGCDLRLCGGETQRGDVGFQMVELPMLEQG